MGKKDREFKDTRSTISGHLSGHKSSRQQYSRSSGSTGAYRASPTNSDATLPSLRSTARTSLRPRTRSTVGSRLMLPADFNTPGPDAYNIKSTIGRMSGTVIKGDRNRSFEQLKTSNAVFLLPRLVNATPGPGQYNMKSSIGSGQKSTFGTARRTARFAGDRSNNAIFLLQNYKDSSPSPSKYSIKSSVGSNKSTYSMPGSNTGAAFGRTGRESRFAGDTKARFLLPRIIDKNPSPTHYKRERFGALGKEGSSHAYTFGREQRHARFPGDNRAVFLLARTLDKFRIERPSSYTSAFGRGLP